MPGAARSELLPDFKLPATRRASLGPWDFKQRQNLVVLFHHGLGCEGCRAMLAEWAGRYPELREQEAEVLALSPDPVEELARAAEEGQVPFPLLSDRGGAVLARYLPEGAGLLPAAFVADRYGAVSEVYVAEGHDLNLNEIISELVFIRTRCPECHAEDV